MREAFSVANARCAASILSTLSIARLEVFRSVANKRCESFKDLCISFASLFKVDTSAINLAAEVDEDDEGHDEGISSELISIACRDDERTDVREGFALVFPPPTSLLISGWSRNSCTVDAGASVESRTVVGFLRIRVNIIY